MRPEIRSLFCSRHIGARPLGPRDGGRGMRQRYQQWHEQGRAMASQIAPEAIGVQQLLAPTPPPTHPPRKHTHTMLTVLEEIHALGSHEAVGAVHPAAHGGTKQHLPAPGGAGRGVGAGHACATLDRRQWTVCSGRARSSSSGGSGSLGCAHPSPGLGRGHPSPGLTLRQAPADSRGNSCRRQHPTTHPSEAGPLAHTPASTRPNTETRSREVGCSSNMMRPMENSQPRWPQVERKWEP